MSRIFQWSPASDIGSALDAQSFKAGLEGTVEVIAAGAIALPAVECWVAAEHEDFDEARFLPQKDVPVQRPAGMPDQGVGLLKTVRCPPIQITRLRGAVCIPGGVVVSKNFVLAESFSATWDSYQHHHLRFQDNGWIVNGWPNLSPDSLRSIKDPILYLDHSHINHFGHALLDMLAPAWAFEYCRAYLNVSNIKVICSRPKHKFVMHILEAAGLRPSSIVLIDSPIRCEELLVATKSFQIQEYTSPPAVRLWRAMSTRIAGSTPLSSGRIYISRSHMQTRRLIEEEEVENIFKRHGFRIFHPELFDVATQIRIFAGAELIAGCSGSNMFGIAFQSNAKAIIILVSPLLIHYSEHFLHTSHDGCKFTMVIGSVRPSELEENPGNVHCNWHINTQNLEKLIKVWIEENGSTAL